MLDALTYSIEVVLMFLGLVAAVCFTALCIGLLFALIHDLFFDNKADDDSIPTENLVFYNADLGLHRIKHENLNGNDTTYYESIDTEPHGKNNNSKEKDSK